MAGNKIGEQAVELLSLGLSKQQVFDQLHAEHPEQRPKKLAELLRYMPTQQARERYRDLQRLLLALIVLSVVLRIGHSVGNGDVHWERGYPLISLVPFASILFGWGVYHWHGQHFGWVGWINVLGAISLLSRVRHLAGGAPITWPLGADLLSGAIGALSLYLFIKVFPDYRTAKDPITGIKYHAFPPEEPRGDGH